eukprot:Plantae.Rhodophyta-Palmaria_palmata.ctg9365.p2 GENE.Plantae.Rhodophyta-Palmaria_palmata.ctg9365~~Plantae.Rhodophyta-Palmaria_palmata.ctg9365.p2  ORF type:complete len:193 (-),score=33.96 Plantae.Rhodophyta-Palmaria_palmata.ctg9365:81-659(-)
MQQEGDMTIDRQIVINQLEDDKKGCIDFKKGHRLESSNTADDYKRETKDAFPRFSDMRAEFRVAVERAKGASPEKRIEIAKRFASLAKSFEKNISTDYQIDKHVPLWNRSPQPGPTYFMSKKTLFVHIVTVESFGETNGPSGIQRNHVYVREERIGGSKTFDDTVGTFFDCCLVGLSLSRLSRSCFEVAFLQ